MATQERLDAAFEWAKAQVGKTYKLDGFGDTFDCSTYMSGIATMIRDGKASRWFTTWSFNSGEKNPLPGWERDLEAPFMIGITDNDIGHTGGTLLGVEFEATAAGNRVVRMGDVARGAKDPLYQYVYGYRPSILEGEMAEYTTYTVKASDTLTTIAATYKTTPDVLAKENSLLFPGQALVVVDPATPVETKPVTYTATTSDTWDTIAGKYNLTVSALMTLNNIKVAPGSSYIVGYTTGSPTATPGRISTDKVTFLAKDDSTVQGSGNAFCEKVIRQALSAIGLPVTDAWVKGYLTIASRESAYNASQWRVNTTDSNAIGAVVADGNPFQCSRGGWQCIPQTFAQYHQSGTSLDIYDPIANCAASINYVRSVYHVSDDGSDLAAKVQQADATRPPRGY